jgi:hypothetical protein
MRMKQTLISSDTESQEENFQIKLSLSLGRSLGLRSVSSTINTEMDSKIFQKHLR